jgi:hypothetical protein
MGSHSTIAGIALTFGALVLAGCGGEGARSAPDDGPPARGGGSTTSEAETVDVPTSVAKSPICGKLDARAAAESMGLPAGAMRLLINRAPGDKFDSVMGGKTVSTTWTCMLGKPRGDADSAYVFAVMEDKPATAMSVRAAVDESKARGSEGKGARCTREAEESWGEAGEVLACVRPAVRTSSRFQSGYTTVTYRGLFGDVDLRCGVGTGEGADADALREAADTICADVLAAAAD